MKETGEITDHPCSKSFDGFLICLRRYPDTYDKKMQNRGGKVHDVSGAA